MSWLIDTSVIARTIHTGSPLQQSAINALVSLRERGEILCIVPQILIEFWAIATRPSNANGLGLSIEDAANELSKIKLYFIVRPENESIFGLRENLVTSYRVTGKTAHDARIVAAMQAHSIDNILTFNVSDFKRYVDIVEVFDPQDLTKLP